MKKFAKALFSICMVAAVTAALIPSACLSGLAAWGGGMAQPTLNSEGYYLIDSGEKLAWFSNRVNTGSKTIKGKQTTAIDMGGTNLFTPIGTSTSPFLGVYDGGGYAIANLKISATGENAGLFGYIGSSETTRTLYDDFGDPYTETVTVPSEINNVTLTGANITGTKNVGGIVGSSAGGQISGCAVAGTVTGTGGNTGGVVGYNFKSGIVLNCLNEAAVSGTLRVGGIAGYILGSSSVDGCCNVGTVSAASYVGGIVGTSSGSTVAHCYNKGAVSASDNVCGGLVGYGAYGELYSLFTIGTVQCPGEFTGMAIGNMFYGTGLLYVYYDRDVAASDDDFATGAEHALMLDGSFLVSLNYAKDVFVGDYFNTNNGYPLLRWQLIGWDGSLGRPETDSSGTYLITSGSELAWFAALVNGQISGMAQNTAANARVMRDILLNAGLDESSIPWTPIGSVQSPYVGTFNGGEYRISGVYIHDTSRNDQGLFGRIGEGGSVKNIFLESSKITAAESVGGIAGSNYGTIQNCFNYSAIRSSYYTGGIAGANGGTIENCGNSGDVYGSVSAGGITGENTGGTVTSCFNMSHIYSLQRTGGIIGSNYGIIRYCYNNGKVEGASSTGGVVGYQSSNAASNNFYSCYNIGLVVGAQNAGAVVGYFINGNVSYCYYDTDRSGVSDAVATGKTTEEMAGATLYSFAGFSSAYWVIRTPETYFVYCPELRVFYNSTNTLLKNTSRNSAAVLRLQYTVMAEVDGELPTYYSSLAGGAAHIGTGAGTLVQVRDTSANVTAEISGSVTVRDNDRARTVTRAVGFDEPFFDVKSSGALTLTGSAANRMVFDGGHANSQTGESLVYVESGGQLTLENGVVLKENYTQEDGGAVYLEGGTLQMNGGTIRDNAAARYGGAIYSVGGSVIAASGTVSGNTAQNGGAFFFEGRTAESTLDMLTISGNSATYGGAIYNRNSTVTVSGGTISGNTASNTGGTAYNTGTLIFSGGTVTGSAAPTAAGIYQNGTLSLSGPVSFGAADVIYLPTGKTVNNSERITTNGVAAYLTLQTYTAGQRVLEGDACAANYAKYVLNIPAGQPTMNINSSGCLVAKTLTNVAMVSKFGSYDVYYTSLKEAVDAIGEDETGLVTMISDDTVEETITVRGNVTVTVLGDEAANRTITRYRTCTGSMFNVLSGGTLEFGAPGTLNNAALVVDGGSNLYGTYGDSIITNAGTVHIRDGATLCNASKSGSGAAINSSGTLEMTGGVITNCTATNGGAVYNTGTFEMIGGSITGCTATNGGAVRSTNTLSLQSGTLSGNTASANGGAVYASGTAAFEGGVVQANTAANGGGVYIEGGTWSLPGGTITIITKDEHGDTVYGEENVTVSILENRASGNGGGVYIGGGTGTFSAGCIDGNSAKLGGGMYLAGNTACTVTAGTMQNNTASTRGGAIFHTGSSLTLQNATLDSSNDVYLASGKTVIPAGSAAHAVLTPATFAIGTQVLSGSAVSSLYTGFTISNDRYFIVSDGTLNTSSLSAKESSAFYVDYTEGFIFGIDPQNNTVAAAIAGFDNASTALVVTDASGVVQSADAKVCTGYVLQLRSGSTVLDQKTFVLVGDADADGDFDGEDAVIAYAIAAGKLTKAQLGAAKYRAADADNSGTIDMGDGDLLRACGMCTAVPQQG